jgi:hypothetical protein
MCNSRTCVHLGNLPVVRIASFCKRCNFKSWVSVANSQAGQAQDITELISAVWRFTLVLALNRTFSNLEHTLIYGLNELASIIYIGNLRVILMSMITPGYFT